MDGLQDVTTLPPAFSLVNEELRLIGEEIERKAGVALLERIRRPYAEYKKANPWGHLCQRCAGIHWSLLLHSEPLCHHGEYHRLQLFEIPESSQELSVSSCPFCLLLSSSDNRTVEINCTCYKLRHLDGRRVVPRHDYDWTHHAPCLGVTGRLSRYVLQLVRANTQHYVLRKLTPDLIDYEILRHWLRHCKHYHHTKCNPSFSSFIPDLRVYDCKTEKVVAAPEDTTFRYIALSYVWGGVEMTPEEPKEFPATVRDAITVTLKLGYRYLWVDQLVRSCASDEMCDLY